MSDRRRNTSGATGASTSGHGPGAPGDLTLSLLRDIDSFFENSPRNRNFCQVDSEIEYQVMEVREERVYVVFSMPSALLNGFVGLLDSLHSLMGTLNRKVSFKALETRAFDLDAENDRQESIDNFRKLVLSRFDEFIAQGMAPKQAISATNKALKEKGHPWAVYHMVEGAVRSEGRLRKSQKKGGKR